MSATIGISQSMKNAAGSASAASARPRAGGPACVQSARTSRNPTNGIQRKIAYVGWTTASTRPAAAVEAKKRSREGSRSAESASASAAGTRSCRDDVAGEREKRVRAARAGREADHPGLRSRDRACRPDAAKQRPAGLVRDRRPRARRGSTGGGGPRARGRPPRSERRARGSRARAGRRSRDAGSRPRTRRPPSARARRARGSSVPARDGRGRRPERIPRPPKEDSEGRTCAGRRPAPRESARAVTCLRKIRRPRPPRRPRRRAARSSSVRDEPSANVTASAREDERQRPGEGGRRRCDTPRARASAQPGARTSAVAKRSRR